ncbi:MAG: cation diffusion facilitator family transporter [Candidatus Poseidoniaceae archaeon]|nr:cation diffusion facilitator family transporter [Candidatus Poseidoniaceae archaeon]
MTERDSVARKVTIVGAIVNVLLAGLKAFVGILTSSASLIADAIHSISDLVSDMVVYVAILFGSREADENHQYGHRRYETLALFVVGIMIIIAGIGLGYEMINRIQDSDDWTSPGQFALLAAAASIIVKELLYHYTIRAGNKFNHALLQANAVHHRTDALSSLVVLIGLLASEFGFTVGDLAAALVVSFMLTRVGLKIVYEALLEVSEAGVDSQTFALMEKTIKETDGVIDMHLLRTKTIGGEIFAESHAQVNPYLSVTQGHEIAHRIVERVENVVPALKELTVHIDPEDDELESPELPNCSHLEKQIRDIWSTHHESSDLLAVTLHILHAGVEVVLRVSSKLEDSTFQNIRDEITSLESTSKVEFVSLR